MHSQETKVTLRVSRDDIAVLTQRLSCVFGRKEKEYKTPMYDLRITTIDEKCRIQLFTIDPDNQPLVESPLVDLFTDDCEDLALTDTK